MHALEFENDIDFDLSRLHDEIVAHIALKKLKIACKSF